MNNISAVIVIKDNPQYIFRTLDSLKDFASEIIIIDIGIKPQLLKKLKKDYALKIIKYKKEVIYVELIREEVKKYAKNNYLVYLDPDEELPSSLKLFLNDKLYDYDYFKIPRKNIVFGKWISHSRWWPDYQIRFFNKDKVIWSKKIHSQPKTAGNGYTLPPEEKYAIIHHNYQNIDQFINKLTRYTKAESQQLIADGKQYTFIQAGKQGMGEFVSRFFTGQGYKDGIHGLVLAFLQIFYYLLVYFYYWEAKKYQLNEPEIKTIPLRFFSHGLTEISHWSHEKITKKKLEKLKYKIINKIVGS